MVWKGLSEEDQEGSGGLGRKWGVMPCNVTANGQNVLGVGAGG